MEVVVVFNDGAMVFNNAVIDGSSIIFEEW